MKEKNKPPHVTADAIVDEPSKETSNRMRKVRGKDTKIERAMESLLRQIYLKYERQSKIIGHPDFILRNEKVAIFCDSAFWHGRRTKKQRFKRNRQFWEHKINENRRRDKRNNRMLSKLGWTVLRFWDEDILKNPSHVARLILKEASPPPRKRLAAVDLFCGVGGMTHGFFLEGIDVIAGYDLDKTCKYAYEKNNLATFIEKDIDRLDSREIGKLYPRGSVRILMGCAPCQPFSPYASTKRKESDKWKLLYEFSRIINEVQPDIVTMENVPRLISYEKGKVFREFVDNLRSLGYHLWYGIVSCLGYGIPQRRRRLVLLASLLGAITLVKRTHLPEEYVSVQDAIGNLEPISAGSSSTSDPLHRARNLSSKNLLRITLTPQGGNWRQWPEELVLECHRKDGGKTFCRNVYGRMRWDEPSPTITTEFVGLGRGRFGHPVQDRAISLREGALLQTFPSYYDFVNPDIDFSSEHVAIHIGNAVPVRLGQIIAKSIKQHVGGFYDR